MQVVEFLRQIRDGEVVGTEDITEFIHGVAAGDIPDYQAAAYLMAVFHRGMTDPMTVASTLAMRDSGEVVDLSHISGIKVDKHSTGGVGDKISIPLAPLVAACGVPVPMISGRGLGHTGGTLDKLEAIPGFRVDLEIDAFRHQVADIGVALIGATGAIAPADKKLYALRDVTATVESVPLITGSILSKKLAEGINGLVLDVKVGRGAFMKDEASARELAESLVRVGTGAGLEVRACLTRMEAPLGRTIGNALEIRESIQILQGVGPADTTELTLTLAEEMLVLGGVSSDFEQARAQLSEALRSGAALDKFRELIVRQGGDGAVVEEPDRLPTAAHKTAVIATRGGCVTDMDAYRLGVAAMGLGAGRARAEDTIDPAVGLELCVTVGDTVTKDDTLAWIHHNGPAGHVLGEIIESIVITNGSVVTGPLVIDRIGL